VANGCVAQGNCNCLSGLVDEQPIRIATESTDRAAKSIVVSKTLA